MSAKSRRWVSPAASGVIDPELAFSVWCNGKTCGADAEALWRFADRLRELIYRQEGIRMNIDVVAAEGVYAQVSAQQEGAYVMVIISRPDGVEGDEDRDLRIDTMLTPDQAEFLSFELARLAKDTRTYGGNNGG